MSLEHNRFTTDDYAPAVRHDAFRQAMSVMFDTEDLTVSKDAFQGHVQSTVLGESVLTEVRSSGQKYLRSSSKIAQDGLDHYVLQHYVGGGKDLRTGDRGVVGASNLMLIDTAQPYASSTQDFHNISLVIPRRLMTDSLRRPDHVSTRVLDARTPLARLALDSLLGLWQALPHLSADEAALVVKPTMELAVVAFNGDIALSEHGPRAVRQALFVRVRRYIDSQLHDPDLSPQTVATHCGVSRSRLYEVAAPPEGIAAWIRGRRLKRARSMLQDPNAHLSIAEVAVRCGFRNQSAFGRTFKRVYGATPKEMRRGGQPSRSGTQAEHGDRMWTEWLRNL